MTGSSDGVVRMWSLDFVEVPIKEKHNLNESNDEMSRRSGQEDLSENTPTPTILQSLTQQLAKKMSVSYELGNDTLRSLQEILAANVYVTTPQPQRRIPELNNTQSEGEEEEGSSDTENCENTNEDTLDNVSDAGGEVDDEKSIYDTSNSHDNEGAPSEEPGEDNADGPERAKRSSGSTQNSASDFVVVSNEELAQDNDPNSKMDDDNDQDEAYGNASGSCGGRRRRRRLQSDGYTWSRQLVFRAKLTMHTAFERPDNVDPAAVTALAVSKDHRTIYVGDEKGRVFSWSVSSRPGKGIENSRFINLSLI